MKQSRTYRGFTLIEVMISIVVLSIAVLGFSAMTLGTIRGLSISDKLTTATTLAQTKMEEPGRVGFHALLSESQFGALLSHDAPTAERAHDLRSARRPLGG